ncbi:MAG: M23 family metallopeptidase [Maricaulaceae bacterium]
MLNTVLLNGRSWINRVFPERQIYHRSGGEVKFLVISPRAQIFAVGVLSTALIWSGFATVNLALGSQISAYRETQTRRTMARYEDWLETARAREASALALLETRSASFDQSAREFERRHDTLKRLLEHTGGGLVGRRGAAPVALNDKGEGEILMAAAPRDFAPRVSRVAMDTAPSEDTLGALKSEQDGMILLAEEAAQDRIERLHAVFRMTGLDAGAVMGESASGLGGPFIGLSEREAFQAALDLEDDFARRVARVAQRVAEAEALETALLATPTRAPVGPEARLTDKFGPRLDPFTRRPASHPGMDFAAHYGAPVAAAAPGRVAFVGWQGGYGRVVEIDHGLGFKTRYAHLSKALVKRGDSVEAGEVVGRMGSTGRSTGVHLHYEIWFKGKVYDPEKFLQAGRYVQQG